MSKVAEQESAHMPRHLKRDDLETFLALLESRRPAEWKMSRRTYYRWAACDLSEALEILFDNPELLQAFAADGLRSSHAEALRKYHARGDE